MWCVPGVLSESASPSWEGLAGIPTPAGPCAIAPLQENFIVPLQVSILCSSWTKRMTVRLTGRSLGSYLILFPYDVSWQVRVGPCATLSPIMFTIWPMMAAKMPFVTSGVWSVVGGHVLRKCDPNKSRKSQEWLGHSTLGCAQEPPHEIRSCPLHI